MHRIGLTRLGTEPSAQQDFKAFLTFADLRHKPQVVHIRQRVVVFPSREGHFDFAPHFLAHRVAQEIAEDRIGVRGNVKHLIGIYTGQR